MFIELETSFFFFSFDLVLFGLVSLEIEERPKKEIFFFALSFIYWSMMYVCRLVCGLKLGLVFVSDGFRVEFLLVA